MIKKKEHKFWFCTGSQDLYGDEVLQHVAAHSKEIVEGLNKSGILSYEVVWKPVTYSCRLFDFFMLTNRIKNHNIKSERNLTL